MPTLSHLEDIRSAIDSIDQSIIDLIAQRQEYVVQAGALKKDEDAVRAPARVEQVISKVRAQAEKSGVSPDVVENTYRAMIDSFINLEMNHLENNS